MVKPKILAAIVVFNPDLSLLKRNIKAIVNDVDRILIWNNSPECFDLNSLRSLNVFVEVCSCGENIGISKALNHAWRYARQNSYSYLLTMDQDSVWINFKGFLNNVFSFENPNNIFGPEYRLVHGDCIREGEYRITSGMLVPIAILDKIGGYYEKFVVDGIDLELCYRAREYGYKVYYVAGSTLEHRAGSNLHCNFMGVHFCSDGYSPFRILGIIRNHLIVFRRFNVGIKMKKAIIFHYYIKMPIKILFGEADKGDKLIAYLRGVYRGLMDSY